MSTDATAALTRFWEERIPFNRRCGFSVTRWDDEGVVMEVEQTDDLTNGVGSVHGGVVASLVDTAANAAAITPADFGPGSRAATVSITVNYVSPARGHLVAHARRGRERGSVHSVTVEVRDDGGELVAQGLVTVKVSAVGAPDRS